MLITYTHCEYNNGMDLYVNRPLAQKPLRIRLLRILYS